MRYEVQRITGSARECAVIDNEKKPTSTSERIICWCENILEATKICDALNHVDGIDDLDGIDNLVDAMTTDV